MNTDFDDDQYARAYPDGVEHHWWQLTRNKIIFDELQQLSGNKHDVLEIGCGRGIVVKYMRDAGIKCSGVELARTTAIAGIENDISYGVNAEDLPAARRDRYTLIMLLDVIEHLSKPSTFLKKLESAFPNLTHVLITVPARSELWSNYDDFYGHQQRYTLQMIQRLSRDLSWTLISNSYFFHSLYFPALALTQLGINRLIDMKPPNGTNRLLHKFISLGLLVDYRVVPKWAVGTSIVSCFSVERD